MYFELKNFKEKETENMKNLDLLKKLYENGVIDLDGELKERPRS